MKNNNGAELTGIREIARRARVSIATVDRVLHKRTGVSDKTREKINQIISDLNYQPNILARRLASRKIIRLATLIPQVSLQTSFWEAPLKGIAQAEKELHQYGIRIEKTFYDQEDLLSFKAKSDVILKNKPDGVLIAPSFVEESRSFVEKCAEENIPYVFINSDISDADSLCYIGPDLYQSGYLAAHLVSYLLGEQDEMLVLHISGEIDNRYHLLKKEEGFRKYFKEHKMHNPIITTDIPPNDDKAVKNALSPLLASNNKLKLIFVTNSRVSTVARYLEKSEKDILLMGYDFLQENIQFLQKGIIDFLICQKPTEQAYRGIMALYQHLVLSSHVENKYYMPIDIITKENFSFYRN